MTMRIFLNHRYFIDLHVHTSRYSPCAEGLNPETIPAFMKANELHGVIITEHDTMWGPSEINRLNRGLKNRRIYNGVELSSSEGHFVIIGIDSLDALQPGLSIDQIVECVNQDKAAIILVHHHRFLGNGKPVDVVSLPDEISAIEVSSSITCGIDETEARNIARMKNWHPVAGSDAHHIDNIGATFTAFETLPADEKELAHAIKNGLGIPMRAGAKRNKFKQYAT